MHDPIRFSQNEPGDGGPWASNQLSDGRRQRAGGSSNKVLWIVLALVAVVSVWGWSAVQKIRSAAETTQRLNNLSQFGKGIHLFYEAKRKMPANEEELRAFTGDDKDYLRKAGIDVVWNAVGFKEEKRGTSSVIIAWYTKPADDGRRLVLVMDGSVMTISPDEFREIPRCARKRTSKRVQVHWYLAWKA